MEKKPIDELKELMQQCGVGLEQLAQKTGQPQWLVDAVFSGKVKNETSISALIAPLKKMQEEAEKKASLELQVRLVNEQLKEDERVLSQKVIRNMSKKRYGTLINKMMQFIVHNLHGAKLATVLAKQGYRQYVLIRIKSGQWKINSDYFYLVALCTDAINRKVFLTPQKCTQSVVDSWQRYAEILHDNTGMQATIEEYEILFDALQRAYRIYGEHIDTPQKSAPTSPKKGKRKTANTWAGLGSTLDTESHAVRHSSYSVFSRGNDDYGLLDT